MRRGEPMWTLSLINGRVVMEKRRLLSIDEARVMAEVRRIAERIKTSLE